MCCRGDSSVSCVSSHEFFPFLANTFGWIPLVDEEREEIFRKDNSVLIAVIIFLAIICLFFQLNYFLSSFNHIIKHKKLLKLEHFRSLRSRCVFGANLLFFLFFRWTVFRPEWGNWRLLCSNYKTKVPTATTKDRAENFNLLNFIKNVKNFLFLAHPGPP